MKHSKLQIKVLALHSLETLSDVRIKVFMLLFKLRLLFIPNPSLPCLLLLLSVVNNYLVVILVCVAFESSVINLI